MDSISDFLTRIRNASAAKHEKVDIPSSSVRAEIARVLRETGFIRNFKVVKDSRQGMMRVYLKYGQKGEPILSEIHRVSKPGRRYYVRNDEIPQVRSGFGHSVLSTNKGIMSGDDAKKQQLGGELLLKVW